jgi:phosphomannomutase
VAGFEANGGFLLQTPQNGLQPLPTRDSTLPILAVPCMAKQKSKALSELVSLLPARFTQSDRIQNLPTARSQAFIRQLAHDDTALQSFVSFTGSRPASKDETDGLRITLADGAIIHLRPSGNAPELRCYTEADSAEKAQHLLSKSLEEIQKTLRD